MTLSTVSRCVLLAVLSAGAIGCTSATTESAVDGPPAASSPPAATSPAAGAPAVSSPAVSTPLESGTSAGSAVEPAPETIAAPTDVPAIPPVATDTSTVVATEGSESCPPSGHAAVVDRAAQQAWLCTDGAAGVKFPVTTAVSQPDPNTYRVYARERMTTSRFGGHLSYLDNFVAFSYGKNTGARIAFHAVPRDRNGNAFQPYDTLGDPAWFGDSSGCIRVTPEESVRIWEHLADGDPVVVIS